MGDLLLNRPTTMCNLLVFQFFFLMTKKQGVVYGDVIYASVFVLIIRKNQS